MMLPPPIKKSLRYLLCWQVGGLFPSLVACQSKITGPAPAHSATTPGHEKEEDSISTTTGTLSASTTPKKPSLDVLSTASKENKWAAQGPAWEALVPSPVPGLLSGLTRYQTQGNRGHQEDRSSFLINEKKGRAILVILDGHGGHAVSEVLHKHLPQEIDSIFDKIPGGEPTQEALAKVLLPAYHSIDDTIYQAQEHVRNATLPTNDGGLLWKFCQGYMRLEEEENAQKKEEEAKGEKYAEESLFEAGTTAIVVVVTKNYIYFINLGDSRALLIQDHAIKAYTDDHKPDKKNERLDERARIEKAGGNVSFHKNCMRIDLDLAVSRGFGDFHLKNTSNGRLKKPSKVSNEPDITRLLRDNSTTTHILLSSDGLFDFCDKKLDKKKNKYDESIPNVRIQERWLPHAQKNNLNVSAVLQEKINNLVQYLTASSKAVTDNTTVLIAEIPSVTT